MDKKIPFGLKGTRLVGIEEVASGLSCGCVCPECGRKLQAKKGSRKSHHFSHNPSDEDYDCESALETTIHLMAKQILAEEQHICLPKLKISRSMTDSSGERHTKSKTIDVGRVSMFTSFEIERTIQDFRPDFVGYTNSEPLIVEIAVTHFSDDQKKKKIRNQNYAALEVDLSKSKLDYSITKQKLKKLIVEDIENKKWLSHPHAKSNIAILESELESKIKNINAALAKQERQYLESLKYKKRLWSKRNRNQISTPKKTEQKNYKTRWFICETCRHVFELASSAVPRSSDRVPCENCGGPVSTKPSDSYYA